MEPRVGAVVRLPLVTVTTALMHSACGLQKEPTSALLGESVLNNDACENTLQTWRQHAEG